MMPTDRNVLKTIVTIARTARYPGIRTRRGYALLADVEKVYPTSDRGRVRGAIERLIDNGSVVHVYAPDGVRLFRHLTRSEAGR